MNIYVGNLARQATEDDVRKEFEPFGKLLSVKVIRDKFSGESRGFGFVEMPKRLEAEAAIAALNGKDLLGQSMAVNEARPKSDSGHRSGGFGRGGSRGGGGYGGGRRSY